MFQICYRIFGNIDELKIITAQEFDADPGICGEIEISFGSHKIGYCPDGVLWEDAYGGEWLDYWFESLLDVLSYFKNGNSYVAFSVMERYGVWLEFRKADSDVIINVTDNKQELERALFITEVYDGFQYAEPLNTKVSYRQFGAEILAAAKRFVKDIDDLNSELRNTVRMKKILGCIKQFM